MNIYIEAHEDPPESAEAQD